MLTLIEKLVPELDLYDAPRVRHRMANVSSLTNDEGRIVRSVERDVIWLFNGTSALGALNPAMKRRFPFASGAVLNFGLRQVFGRVVSDVTETEREVALAMARFEPRLSVQRQSFRLSREGQLVEIALEGFLKALGGRQQLKIRTDLQTLESKMETASYG